MKRIELCCVKRFNQLNICHYNVKINYEKFRIVDNGEVCNMTDDQIRDGINDDYLSMQPGWASECEENINCRVLQEGD